jgi:hypothetical protein
MRPSTRLEVTSSITMSRACADAALTMRPNSLVSTTERRPCTEQRRILEHAASGEGDRGGRVGDHGREVDLGAPVHAERAAEGRAVDRDPQPFLVPISVARRSATRATDQNEQSTTTLCSPEYDLV